MNTENCTITAYYPAKKFPSVSVTGTRCDQMCEHCKGYHLRDMIPVGTSEELNLLAQSLIDADGTGMLISGGCDINGTVPVMSHVRAISKISDRLCINVHTGFIKRDEAEELVRAGVSYFSVDIHQNEGEIRSILHLEHTADDYARLIDDIRSAGGKVVPHITVGFGFDDLLRSGQLLVKKGIGEVVLLSMMPTPGTEIEESILTEAAVLEAAKILSDMGLKVILGCMRDRSLRGLEIKCIEAGIRRIANPSSDTLRWAEEKGFKIISKNVCCCVN